MSQTAKSMRINSVRYRESQKPGAIGAKHMKLAKMTQKRNQSSEKSNILLVNKSEKLLKSRRSVETD